jgi:ABC-type bacteriocin/lantibiotic exporter with double-glycine peptidase domain
MQARVIVFPVVDPNQETNWKFARQTRNRSWFQTQFRRFSKSIGIIILLGFILNLTSIAAPVFILLTYDQVIGSQAADPLIFIGAGAVVVIAIEAILRWVRSLSVAWITSRLDYIVGVALFEKLIGLKPREIEQTLVSSQLSRIKSFERCRDCLRLRICRRFCVNPNARKWRHEGGCAGKLASSAVQP